MKCEMALILLAYGLAGIFALGYWIGTRNAERKWRD